MGKAKGQADVIGQATEVVYCGQCKSMGTGKCVNCATVSSFTSEMKI